MKTFFITGLPRSRTAWLANFFTYEDSFCWHDMMQYIPKLDTSNLDCIKDILKSTNKKYVGDSSSGAWMYAPKIADENTKFVYIYRNTDDCWNEMERIGLPVSNEIKNIFMTGISLFLEEYKPLVIDFNDLGKEDICHFIWDYCIPEIKWNHERWQMLNKLNIQITENEIKSINNLMGGKLCQ